MPRRLAASLSLLAFAICLVAGMGSGNTLATVLGRGLVAMAGTLAVSLVVGTMAQRMLDENLTHRERVLREASDPAAPAASDAPAGGATVTADKSLRKQRAGGR
ncbi:MAG: hypothetical protein JWO31_3195 [Phycisphaerales bacterium]|nr:hypothetical protein [Phycisphaerales bacterium]